MAPRQDVEETSDWTPRVRRITTPDVAEQGKLTFIRSLIGERRFDEAEEELKSLLDTNPHSYLGNLNLGRLCQRKQLFDRAVEHFETARAANPTQAEAAVLAGTAHFSLKDLDLATEAFEAALALDPKRASAHFGLAQVLFHRNQLELSQASLQQALMFDPQLQQARALLARIHNHQGDHDATKKDIEELLSARPNQLRPTIALARIHLGRDEPKEALALLEAATTHHENDAQLWTLLGRVKLSLKDYGGAEVALRRVLAIDQGQRRELAPHLVDALLPQGKLDEAWAVLDRMPEMARQTPRMQIAYGKFHMAAKNYRQAAETYRAALLRHPDGEALVLAVTQHSPQAADGEDWMVIAEIYEHALHDVRRPAGDDGERSARRMARVARRRQAARTAGP